MADWLDSDKLHLRHYGYWGRIQAGKLVESAMSDGLPPGVGPKDGLALYWHRPVKELAAVPTHEFSPQQAERHKIYSLLTMALIAAYWNGNKLGAVGCYPDRGGLVWNPEVLSVIADRLQQPTNGWKRHARALS